MKRIALLVTLLAAMAVCSTAAGNLAVKKTQVKRTWAITAEGKEFAPEGWTPGIDAEIDMPTGNDALSVAVVEWMASRLGVEVNHYANADQLIDALVAHLTGPDSEGSDVTQEFTITKVYETDKVVSFEISGYDYPAGAAHGMPYCDGATFDKNDAQNVNNLLVKEKANLRPLIIKGLVKNLDLHDEDELAESLFENDLNKLERPNNAPWMGAEGIVFQYSAYEIAPYAAGMPAAVIPLEDIKPYLTTLGNALLR